MSETVTPRSHPTSSEHRLGPLHVGPVLTQSAVDSLSEMGNRLDAGH